MTAPAPIKPAAELPLSAFQWKVRNNTLCYGHIARLPLAEFAQIAFPELIQKYWDCGPEVVAEVTATIRAHVPPGQPDRRGGAL